jgi:NADH-quinone oxidoreductase subunit L
MSELTRVHALVVAIPALSLLSAIVTAALGPRILRARSHLPTILALAGSCALSAWLLSDVWRLSSQAGDRAHGSLGWSTTVDLWTWARIDAAGDATRRGEPANSRPEFLVSFALQVDSLTAIMLAMVTFVATCVAIYSIGYMRGDSGYWRFFAYVSLFVFSMTMLVSVSNFVLLYAFWEAVGLCSYLLIGFWYERPQAAAAAKKAFLVNRVGDFGFALALFLIWVTYGTFNFHDTRTAEGETVAGVLGQTALADPTRFAGGTVGLAVALLLMFGACGKSAQFPLHVWLPDAMEGPTPVSALIHAATMVTAGVYLVARCTPLFLVSSEAQFVVAIIGGLTAFLAGIIAIAEMDLKRILAYSTISQLGYMFLSLGTGSLAGVTAGMFHLVTHAFFKALLFLGAGSVMHATGGVIDLRRFGGLRHRMPITHGTFLVGCLALAGIPPLSGFFSKDAILAAVYQRGQSEPFYQGLAYVAFATALLTALYMFRAYFLTFYGEERLPPEAGDHAHESPPAMVWPLIVLAICAAAGGVLGSTLVELLGRSPSLSILVGPHSAADEHGGHGLVAAVSVAAAVSGIALAAILYGGGRREASRLARLLMPLHYLARNKFYLDEIYTGLVVWPGRALATACDWIDRGLVDGLVNLVGRIPAAVGALLRHTQIGLVPFYATLMILGLLALVGSLLL